jgi:hypothetical protein
MKSLSNRAFALVVISSTFLLASTSCKKSNSGGSSAGISATVNGTAWTTSFPINGFYVTANQEFELGGLQVKSGDSTGFALAFLGPVVLNHPMSSDTAGVDIGYISFKTQTEYDGGQIAGHSILNITSYDGNAHKIAGTFSGVLYNLGGSDSLVITNGSFNSTYTVQ